MELQSWSWVKFINDDFYEWCGEFRGFQRQVAVSQKEKRTLILTSDYLFMLDCNNGELIEYESHPQYRNLTVTPFGNFLIADYYSILLIEATLKGKKEIEGPIKMDSISFHEWSGNKLRITCEEFLNWRNNVELEFNAETLEITMKRANNKTQI